MEKRRIHVLTTYNSPNSSALIHPLLVNRRFFDKKDIKFYFFSNLNDRVYNCDAIFLNSKYFRTWHGERKGELYDALSRLKKRVKRVIWFDTTDSTGATQFNVMPFVDAYYKAQLLKDRQLYKRIFRGYRIYTEYYANRYKVKDEQRKEMAMETSLKDEDMHKLHLSWNSAMNDWGSYAFLYGRLLAKLRTSLPLGTNYTARFIETKKERKQDISARIGITYSKSAIRCQRENVGKLLGKFGVDLSPISRRRYLNEMKSAKIGVSPFGWGEICYRDFEIIINGALLFKADMSHLETWPPLYAANETYVPFSWDLKDFEEKLRGLLNDKEKIAEISRKAQELYAYYLYGDGRVEFCNKVMDIIMGTPHS